MLFPVLGEWSLSSGYNEKRPLSVPEAERWHTHSAWDIAAPTGTEYRSPEDGRVQYFSAVRNSKKRTMADIDLPALLFDIQGHHYFYDVYGALCFVHGVSGNTYVFAHSYLNQVWHRGTWHYIESAKEERYPVMAWYTDIQDVHQGSVLGRIGNAGFSTGPHIHHEIHPGRSWATYDNRVHPGDVYKEFAWRDE